MCTVHIYLYFVHVFVRVCILVGSKLLYDVCVDVFFVFLCVFYLHDPALPRGLRIVVQQQHCCLPPLLYSPYFGL